MEEEIDSRRGASRTRCLAMEDGGGFEVERGREVDGGCSWVCVEAGLWSPPDRSLFLSQALSFSFSGSSDFFQRGPKARLNLLEWVLCV